MRNYIEEYFYDEVGNIDRINIEPPTGTAANPNDWIQKFTIDPDQLDPTKEEEEQPAHRLRGWSQAGKYTYDTHGNMTIHAPPTQHGMGFQRPAAVG